MLNKIEEAINEFNTVIEINDKIGWAYFFRGLVFDHKNDIASAANDFKKALELDNNFVERINAQREKLENLKLPLTKNKEELLKILRLPLNRLALTN